VPAFPELADDPVVLGFELFDSDELSLAADEVAPASDPVPGFVSDESVDAPDLEAEVPRASFLAQPEPLKTIAGADSTLRRGPPHASQAEGPGVWIPWTTSTRRPQEPHSYS
jgi:hypothetical protein